MLNKKNTFVSDLKKEYENKENHKYRLDIIYDKDKTQVEEDIKEKVEIKIHSIQKV